jgi:RNA polymerase sigma factor (sigma-70 family)
VGRTTKRTAGPLPGSPPSGESALLVARWQAGDEAAAEALFNRYADRLARLAASRLAQRLATRIDPEDVVMSAYRSFFVGAREGRFTLERGGDLWRLLVQVTLHKLYRQAARHRAARRSVDRQRPLDSGGDWKAIAVRGETPTPDEVAAAADELARLLACLSPRGRQVVELRMQGYEMREMGHTLGVSERTVRRWLNEARGILARELPADVAGLLRADIVEGGPAARPASQPQHRRTSQAPRREADTSVASIPTIEWNDLVLERQIGAGASGKVYRAARRSTGQPFAVKFLRKAIAREPAVIARFLREAETVAALAHPGIVAIRGLGQTPSRGHFLVMELVAGEDLQQVLARGVPEPERAAGWVTAAARIVQFAHEQGVIHCDLKPSNLLLDDRAQVRITDFGLAVRLVTEAPAALLAGTPAFMAPEQVDSCWGAISPRTDVWGLGAVLYALIYGQAPHIGRSVPDTLARVVSGTPVKFPRRRALRGEPRVPKELVEVLKWALAKSPDERFASAGELGVSLARASTESCRPT